MSFLIAIIGGYGVGKSVLAQTFTEAGVASACLENYMMGLLEKEGGAFYDAELFKMFRKQYQELKCHDELKLPERYVLAISRYVLTLRKRHGPLLVEIPPYMFASKQFNVSRIFDYVVYVTCGLEIQHGYLLSSYQINEKQCRYLMESDGLDDIYLQHATDIFLNTVSLDRIKWVGSKLLKSYEALAKL